MIRRIGGHTLGFEEMPSIIGYASVVGKKESEGPLGKGFDKIIYDSYNGKNTYEQAESTLQFTAVETAMQKAGVKAEDIDYILQEICSTNVYRQASVCVISILLTSGSTEPVPQWLKACLWRLYLLRAMRQTPLRALPLLTLPLRKGSTVFLSNTAEFAHRPHNGQLRVRGAAL